MYRKICEVDARAHQQGHHGTSRFEHLKGDEADMRAYFEDFARSMGVERGQILSVELRNDRGEVVDRKDLLVELLDHILVLLPPGPRGGESHDAGYWAVVKAVLERRLWNAGPSPPGAASL